mgnify:CR=1 FL=1
MDIRKKVIVDTDFMNYMSRGKDGIDYYFNKIVNDLNLIPVVHEFLYNKEMMGNPLVSKLVKEGKLTVIKYEDFLEDVDDPYYSNLFADLYRYCNERPLNYGKSNFRTYQEVEANLGEIHSVILALYTGYPLFFSNDNGSKTMARTKINTSQYQLDVKNVMDIFDDIAIMKNKTLTKKDFVNLTKGDDSRKRRIQEIKEKWVE